MAKYETGKLCLVLRSENLPGMAGKTITLGRKYATGKKPDGGVVEMALWASSPPIIDPAETLPWTWPEQCLLPLEDDDINKELQDELLETKPKELVQG